MERKMTTKLEEIDAKIAKLELAEAIAAFGVVGIIFAFSELNIIARILSAILGGSLLFMAGYTIVNP